MVPYQSLVLYITCFGILVKLVEVPRIYTDVVYYTPPRQNSLVLHHGYMLIKLTVYLNGMSKEFSLLTKCSKAINKVIAY